MNDHAYYEELTVLAAGGHLSNKEYTELREHLAVCPECRQNEQAFRALVRSGLPLARGEFSLYVDKIKARPDAGVRTRFLARARREGVRLPPNMDKSDSSRWAHWIYGPVAAAGLAAVILVAFLYGEFVHRKPASAPQVSQEVERLRRENVDLTSRIAERDQALASQKKQLQDLRSELGTAAKSAETFRHESEQKGIRLGQSTSETAKLLEELQNRDKQLAASSSEITRINQLRATDQVSLEAQRTRIKEISDQLRIADATLDMERQLVAAGRDIRELLVARQLHVVDVRDTDANGKPSQAFARVFLTEGKSLMFFAFDLNQYKVTNVKLGYQVWGEELGKKGSVRSLGILKVDDKVQNRWALKVENPELLKEINSVFVTVSYPGGENRGQRLLYAYLGEPNRS